MIHVARVDVGAGVDYGELRRAALEAARGAARRALALDPGNCEAQVVIADVSRMVEFDWRGAKRGYREALAGNPSSELAHRGYAFLLAIQGRHDDAIRAAELARELDPLCLVPSVAVAWTRYASGQYEQAVAECRHTLAMGPDYVPAWRLLAGAELQRGDVAAAVSALEEARGRASDHPQLLAWLAHAYGAAGRRGEALQLISELRGSSQYVSPYLLALAFVGITSTDAAFEALAQAYLDRDPLIAHVAIEPRFEPLRGDARYGRLLARLNLG
jgi:tetratricopeptide (TPR) repeat protein